MEEVTVGAGCFWGVQASFDKIRGVLETTVGYMGGTTNDPTYEKVCTNSTGHAEVVHIRFDPEIVSFQEILQVFFKIHDPTQRNRQGPDIGSQYRSVIFYYSPEQKEKATRIINQLNSSDIYKKEIETEIVRASQFHKAEEYHQKYFEKKGSGSCHVF